MKKARAVVDENTKFQAGSLWLRGKTLCVTIHGRGEFHSNEERNREKERVMELLRQALPRYNIEVNMETDKD